MRVDIYPKLSGPMFFVVVSKSPCVHLALTLYPFDSEIFTMILNSLSVAPYVHICLHNE